MTLITISKLTAGEFQQLVNCNNDNNDDSEDKSSQKNDDSAKEELSQDNDIENGPCQDTGLLQITNNLSRDTMQIPIILTVDQQNENYELTFQPNIDYQSLSNYSGDYSIINNQL
ncbi:9539_t:CDS:1 [Gigaspora margarita]|uniref:9539_t:CDS:1 n=1 Tax=Gigaspora margarita TaxID=4874 RepID=A0ABN7WVM7_GIGMA|nr:9539_t:CDS:1 [Gigaspora margarita]